MNTKAIQSAIDHLSKVGGGTLIIPKGCFLTGSIELKSNINLYLEKDAVLLGSTQYADYRKLTDHQSLILASDQSHISITGEGTIDGQGRAFALKLDSLFFVGKMNQEDYDLTRPDERVRPTDLQIVNCKDVTVKQVTFKNAACWVQQYIGCENVIIDKIRVDSEAFSNNDGMDIANCRNVRITGCVVNSADDGICLKGSWNDQVFIQNCRIRSSASAIKFGSGVGASNVTIKDIYIYDTYRSALALESVDGNIIENVLVDGLHVQNNNGSVGAKGNSYGGFYTLMAGLSGHPALKAIVPQAPVTDWFMGDDFHHNGALMLVDAFGFSRTISSPRPNPTTVAPYKPSFNEADSYSYYLRTGALKNFSRLMGDSIQFWSEVMDHSNYDSWWKARDSRRNCFNIKPAVMIVGGFFDAEDLYGTINLYKDIKRQSPSTNLSLVVGPWNHAK